MLRPRRYSTRPIGTSVLLPSPSQRAQPSRARSVTGSQPGRARTSASHPRQTHQRRQRRRRRRQCTCSPFHRVAFHGPAPLRHTPKYRARTAGISSPAPLSPSRRPAGRRCSPGPGSRPAAAGSEPAPSSSPWDASESSSAASSSSASRSAAAASRPASPSQSAPHAHQRTSTTPHKRTETAPTSPHAPVARTAMVRLGTGGLTGYNGGPGNR
jgi:hypothetical protein